MGKTERTLPTFGFLTQYYMSLTRSATYWTDRHCRLYYPKDSCITKTKLKTKITSSFRNFCIPVGLISWQRYQFQSGKSLLIFLTSFCIFCNSFSKDLCIIELIANLLAIFLTVCCSCENLTVSRNI